MSSKLKSLKTPISAATSLTRTKSSSAGSSPPTKNATIAATASNNNSNKRFTTSSGSSPFKSFITTGVRIRKPLSQANGFAYDLSNDELHFMGSFKSPMKEVPDSERELLKNGQREEYLARRYEYTPDHKYNFPEATSWRIGWLHNFQRRT